MVRIESIYKKGYTHINKLHYNMLQARGEKFIYNLTTDIAKNFFFHAI